MWRQTKIERLTHELALHKRHRSGVKAERLSTEQAQLFEETAEADLAAMSEDLEQLQPDTSKSQQPKGQARRIRCRPSCRPPRSMTNPTRPPAPAAARCATSARTSSRRSTTPRATSPSSATSGTSGRAIHARPSCRHPCRRTSSTRASRLPGCSSKCWSPGIRTFCHSTGRKASSVGPGWRSRNRRWPSGWARAACICSRWSMRRRPAC